MAIDADYHRTQIEALLTELADLRGRVNQSDLGRSFDYNGTRDRITKDIAFHQEQIQLLDGPVDDEIQGVP